MKNFSVTIEDSVAYFNVEAPDTETARELALEWWDERVPKVIVTEDTLVDN